MVLSWGWFEKGKGVVIFPRFWAESRWFWKRFVARKSGFVVLVNERKKGQ